MEIIGISSTERENGRITYTLYVKLDFEAYFDNPENGRTCIGQKTDIIFVSDHDCSGLAPGMIIDILYGKAITTAKGSFQPIKRIDVLEA